jgi:hypothetical protein
MATQTSTFGSGGGSPFTANCPNGEYISQWYGASGRVIDRIGAKCSDGTNLGPHGGGGGNNWTGSVGGPYTNFSGRGGNVVDKFNGYGGSGGNSWNDSCPKGVATGIFGRSGRLVDQLGIKCGMPYKWCVNNLEDAICSGVDADTLNKACSVNFTSTCVDRKDELTDTTMNKYCEANPYTDICSCYLPPPSFIPPAISGLAQCWNKKCANYGYVPKNMRQSCPNITICTQDMTTSGNNNALTSNIIVQNCSSTTNGQDTSSATTQGGTTNINTGTETGEGSDTLLAKLGIGTPQGMNKTYIWIICAILGAGILLLLMGSDESSSKIERKVDYPQYKSNQPYSSSNPQYNLN